MSVHWPRCYQCGARLPYFSGRVDGFDACPWAQCLSNCPWCHGAGRLCDYCVYYAKQCGHGERSEKCATMRVADEDTNLLL